ncbi:hypothetical protein CUMW_065670 [Citrus unshiu]|nr:hypothetical protein CUMW_065670 [Citrus unshiu]
MVRVLVVLKVEGAFDVVAERTPGAAVDGRPSDLTVGLESTFDQVWSCLVEEEQVGIIGLYGMEGWIQEQIRRKLGLVDDLWARKGLEEKAMNIFGILSKKEFVLC